MTNDLQQARIEAAAKIIYNQASLDEDAWDAEHEREKVHWREDARAVLAAADAHLPSVEAITEVIREHTRSGGEIDGMFYCACGDGDYLEPNHIAEAVHALFGEVAGDE